MNISAIILARKNSKGIPDKNIMNINGKPLFMWSVDQAKASSYIDNIYISSDSDFILNVAKQNNVETIRRPDEYATDTSSSEDALLHALNFMGDVDIVVFLQPTSPLRGNCDIDFAIDYFITGNYDSLFSVVESKDLCLWKNEIDGCPISINFDYRHRQIRQKIEKQYIENGSIYLFKPFILKKYKNRIGGKIGIYKMKPFYKFIEIDEFDDIELCEYFMRRL